MHTQDGTVIKTERQRAADAYEFQTLGLEFGNTIARIIIAKLPNGFSDETGTEVQKVVQDGLSANLDWYRAKGITAAELEAYEAAYYAAA